MKVLVVGGTGYIGSHAVLELLKDDHEVVVLDNLSTGRKTSILEKVTFYYGDITKKEDLFNVFLEECKKKPFDVVMHFASKLLVGESMSMPSEYYQNNVEGVRLLLDTMREFNIKNIIFSSTAAVYGNPINGVCYEEDLLKPINPYGETKLVCENMIKWYSKAYDMHYVIFRYFNVAGADSSLEIGYNYNKKVITHLIPIVAETILNIRDKFTVFGDDYNTEDGTCIRDYIHVSDLAHAHLLGAKYIWDGNDSTIINLGSNNGYSVKEIIEAALKCGDVNYVIGERRAGDPDVLIASNQRAKDILHFETKYNIDDIITSEVAYRKKLG
ncbi:MAG: UDP-glucose 4-epimerase GalE [Bacilli bacterium]|nr:UDP-glucose 4-epimerase GalE [Bacilli bacterium]